MDTHPLSLSRNHIALHHTRSSAASYACTWEMRPTQHISLSECTPRCIVHLPSPSYAGEHVRQSVRCDALDAWSRGACACVRVRMCVGIFLCVSFWSSRYRVWCRTDWPRPSFGGAGSAHVFEDCAKVLLRRFFHNWVFFICWLNEAVIVDSILKHFLFITCMDVSFQLSSHTKWVCHSFNSYLRIQWFRLCEDFSPTYSSTLQSSRHWNDGSRSKSIVEKSESSTSLTH